MTLAEAPVETVPGRPGRRSRRLRWSMAAAAAIVVAGGSVGGFYLAERGNVTNLQVVGWRWTGVAATTVRNVIAGPEQAQVVTARPGRAMSFEVLVMNDSHESQTVLGLAGGDLRDTEEPVHLRMARSQGLYDDSNDPSRSGFTADPVTLAPQDSRWLRYTIHVAKNGVWVAGGSRQEYWTSLDLRVGVGGITKDENVDFLDEAMVIASPRRAR